MILRLTKRILDGPDRYLKDERSGIKVTKTREHLIVYRHGELKLWVDLEMKHVVAWSVRTQAEVNAFNKVLGLVGLSDRYQFLRSGRVVIVEKDGHYYRTEEYEHVFGPESGAYRSARPSGTTS